MKRLTEYQNARLAQRYQKLVAKVVDAERAAGIEDDRLSTAVARYYFKLLAIKDEYEVGRLWSRPEWKAQLAAEFEGDFKVEVSLAPQFMPRDKNTGRVQKISSEPVQFFILRCFAALRFLRGTPVDVANMTTHRRRERALINEYEAILDEVLDGLSANDYAAHDYDLAVEIASVPEQIRGFDTVKDSPQRRCEVEGGRAAQQILPASRGRGRAFFQIGRPGGVTHRLDLRGPLGLYADVAADVLVESHHHDLSFRIVGVCRFPVGPSIASMISAPALPPGLNSLIFFPLATITRLASFARSEASFLPSFLLAGIVSFASIPFASKNLDARVQDVQPLRV